MKADIRGIRDSHRTVEKVKRCSKKWCKSSSDAEFELFHTLFKSMNMKNIYLDDFRKFDKTQDNASYKYKGIC